MPTFPKLKVVEQCMVSPASSCSSTFPSSIPLTYFDLLFVHFPPVQRLFFYDLPVTRSRFLGYKLHNLKLSLSLALRHFYPLAGSLRFPAEGQRPEILCSESDCVSLTIAVSSDDYHELSANHARAADRFRPLLPALPATVLLSVQVTLFSKAGLAIGTTLHHAAADGSAYTYFMKTWALIAKLGETESLSRLPPPIFDRAMVSDVAGLENIFLKDMKDLQNDKSLQAWDLSSCSDLVRATFVLGPDDLHRLSQRTTGWCSPYALACGLAWTSLVRARGSTCEKNEKFGFVTGCRPRLRPAVPASYFGNCLGICCVEMKREDLVTGRSAAAAAEAIWGVIKGLEKEVFEGAENWLRVMREYAACRALTVAGSPKLEIYGVDFGWGRPRKVELVSVERTGAISLAESGELDGGIEVGIALPAREMEEFVASFVTELAVDE